MSAKCAGQGTENNIRESNALYSAQDTSFRYQGPVLLPLDHQDIRVYIDNLFIEGKLTPVESTELAVDSGSWIQSGIRNSGAADEKHRLSRLFEHVTKMLPAEHALYSEWIAFALKWGELSALVHSSDNNEFQCRFIETGNTLNTVFTHWLQQHYSSLINLPPANLAMLHHLPRHMARTIEDSKNSRVAVIVIDGLALDQWVTIRQVLQQQDPELLMRESATFAWIPTLTSVSRQAIFAGKPPFFFPKSILTTDSEEKAWKQFWEDCGLSPWDVVYQRGLGGGDAASLLDSLISSEKTRVTGLVVDKVDKIMHGMQLGSAGMHNQIQQWCQNGFLHTLIGKLIDSGYEVWLTADHGNIQCGGKGRPSEGAIAEIRGERARVYPTPELRSQVAEAFPFARAWEPVGLPAGYFPLLASGRDAFVNPSEAIVGHGGIAIEEVIVPLVKFERKTW